jgi:hypothetical protein
MTRSPIRGGHGLPCGHHPHAYSANRIRRPLTVPHGLCMTSARGSGLAFRCDLARRSNCQDLWIKIFQVALGWFGVFPGTSD